MNVYLRHSNWKLPTDFVEKEISSIYDRKGIYGEMELDKSHLHYPERGDTKIMRKDVISSILAVGEILDEVNLTEEQLLETALFVSNGSFLEEENKHMNRLIKAFHRFRQLDSKKEKRQLLYKNIPPLTALETLTNSTMSFISQYSKVKGLNTTFGNTSYSSFIALQEGFNKLKNNMCNYAIVGGANGGGLYSSLNHIAFKKSEGIWKESLCSGFLMLQTNPTNCSFKIESCKNDKDVPSLLNQVKSSNWKQFFNENEKEDLIVFSGGFTEKEFEANEDEIRRFCNHSFSLNKVYGNTGASAMFLNMIQATQLMDKDNLSSAVLLDRDSYGRETYIKISKI